MLPTYNERENIKDMLEQIFSLGKDFHILVVDDSSPDGTPEIVRREMKAHRRLHLLTRLVKRGIGSAYKDGFGYVLQKIKPSLIVQMDADFSHSPGDIPKLLRHLGDHDVAVGSRYIAGSRVTGWPLKRRLISFIVNFFARIFTGLPQRDVSSGFKCFKKSALEKINLKEIHSNNRSFQFELLRLFQAAGCWIAEVPINFSNRLRGKDKFGFCEAVDFTLTLFYLARRRLLMATNIRAQRLPKLHPTPTHSTFTRNPVGSATHL